MKLQPRKAKLAMLALSVALALAIPVHLQSQAGCIPPPSGLADWWPGDGYASDIKGSHNGLVQGGLTFSPGFNGDAFTFNGSDAIATFGQAGNFGTADFTVVFWLRTTSTRGEAVIEKRPGCGNGHFWGIRKGVGIGAETDDGLGNYVAIGNESPINDGAFHLIGLVRQGKSTLLYVDGMSPVVGTASNVADVGNSASLIVGDSICDGVDGTNHLTGQLDEIQTFDRALSAAEIKSIYDAGSAGQCKNVTLFPGSLSFGSQLVHTPSKPQTVTLTNPGSTTMDISSIAASANFYQHNNCGSSLLAGASCTITVTFRPASICPKIGTLTVTDNAANSPQTVALSGIGTQATLLPATVNFGNQPVGTTSSPQTITLTNYGHRALTIFAVRLTGANTAVFAQTNTCGASVAPGASCTFSVTFTPNGKVSKTATLNVWDDGGDTPQQVTLTGNSQNRTINVATGLDCSNHLITTGGANDCHWTVNGNPAQVVVPGTADWPGCCWAAIGPNSNWVAINANTCCNGPAPYSFNFVFDLSGSNPSAVSLSGLWSIDDTGTLSLNGNQIAALDVGLWGSLHSFSVPAGSPFFRQGSNTLTITMTWTDNVYEAVRLEGTVAGVAGR